MNDGAKFHAKTRRYATAWQQANVRAVQQAALTTKNSVLALTPKTLSGVGKRGARLGVSYNVRGFYGNPTALVRATGPFHLIERDTAPHQIPRTASSRRIKLESGRLSAKRELTGRTLSGRKRLRLPGGWVMGPVSHPGTKGKHPFERGVNRAEPLTRQVFRRAHTTALARTFRG